MLILRNNILVALGYILGGYVGHTLSFLPADVSPIWPPSGIALAALLICGPNILPGLFTGVLIMQAYAFAYMFTSGDGLYFSTIIIAISAGSILQAVTGWYLIEKFVGHNDPLMENRKITRFLLLGGPLSCLIAPFIGTIVLILAENIVGDQFRITFAAWWAGDTIGVLIFAPIVLILFARPRAHWRWRKNSVVYPTLVILVATVVSLNYFYEFDRHRISTEFERQVNLVHASLEDDIRDQIELNSALKAFYDASTEVTESDFNIFSTSLLKSRSGIRALEWIPRIKNNERDHFEKNWLGNTSIMEPGPDNYMIPASSRDEYFPIRYVVPFKGNERALGFDISRNSDAAEAITFARDTGETGVTAPTKLIQDKEMLVGTVLYSPVYLGNPQWDTVEERRRNLVGFVANVFRVTDKVEKILAQESILVDLVIRDNDEHIYSSFSADEDHDYPESIPEKTIRLNIANRIWDFTYTPNQEFYLHHISWNLWLLSYGSFAFVGFACIGLLLLTGQTLRTENVVRERTSELEREIKERKYSEETVQRLAYYDMLTELPNRRLLQDRLERDIASVSRHDTYGAILYIDLDNFKTLNDSMGHQVGDQLLVQVAKRLKLCIREEDTAARLGGDEFVILLREEHPRPETLSERIQVLAQRIKDELSKPFDLNGYLHHMSPSIGITFFSREVNSPDEVLKQADTAMYSAKAKGRNTISFYHPEMQRYVDDRLQLEKDLRSALEHGQFRIFYQPQFNDALDIVSAEALIRWEHPTRGLVSPMDFVPIAEENKLIIPIGEWVIKEVCERLNIWSELNYIGINISPVQLLSEGFIHHLDQVLNTHGDLRKRIMLEMTEGIMIDDMMSTSKIIKEIQKLGVGISIDDFGRGYSSLAYLKHFPLNQLKIDKDFISDIEIDPSGNVIVETIIAMAHHLKLSVIAEGVETRQQLTFLREQGCTGYQGYFFSKPLPANEFTALLTEKEK